MISTPKPSVGKQSDTNVYIYKERETILTPGLNMGNKTHATTQND